MDMQVPQGWRDFELMDAGEYMKLERWGQYIISRPEPRAIWGKQSPHLWSKAHASYQKEGWEFKEKPPLNWNIKYRISSVKREIVFGLRPTDFKHTGVFPEQAANWEWIGEKVSKSEYRNPKILNLFAYTGGATMAAALAGAHVTHVDASKPANMWASENAKLANIPNTSIRWIQDDAVKFVAREQRRGVKYDAIVMDPPRFGRGTGGEMWKLEENLPNLVHEVKKLLSPNPLFFLINAYTADLSHLAIRQLLQDVVEHGNFESGELGLNISGSAKVLPAGIFARVVF